MNDINNKISMKIKSRRKQLNMSQAELADGICTQGTISNIENGNSFPSTVVLKDIALKLGIDLFDINFTEQDDIEKVLDKVSKLTSFGEHKSAYYELNGKINPLTIKSITTKKKYYYYLGSTTLIGLGEPEKAQCIFENIFNDFEMGSDVVDLLIYAGMGVVKVELGLIDEAHEWFEKAELLLKNSTLFSVSNIIEILKIYFNIAKYYSEIEKYEIAIKTCDEGIYWANQLRTSYHLGYLTYEKGFNYYKIGEIRKSEILYNMALSFAITNDHLILKNVIIADYDEFKIKRFMSDEEIKNN